MAIEIQGGFVSTSTLNSEPTLATNVRAFSYEPYFVSLVILSEQDSVVGSINNQFFNDYADSKENVRYGIVHVWRQQFDPEYKLSDVSVIFNMWKEGYNLISTCWPENRAAVVGDAFNRILTRWARTRNITNLPLFRKILDKHLEVVENGGKSVRTYRGLRQSNISFAARRDYDSKSIIRVGESGSFTEVEQSAIVEVVDDANRII